MLMRKVPGFVPASPWGLRLPQKFLFLLFLSGLVTLCFGALFLLPHSSRLKRLFLAPRTQQPGLEVVAEIAGHIPAREQEPPPNPAPAVPAPGEDDPSSRASPRRRKGGLRRSRPTGSREEATAARGNGILASRPGDEGVPFRFDFNAFRSRLRHPVLGTRADESQEPQSRVRAQREKIKEVMDSALQFLPPVVPTKEEILWLSHPFHLPQSFLVTGLLQALQTHSAPCSLLPNVPPPLLPTVSLPWGQLIVPTTTDGR
ncbi:Mannosyl-oligosaccharide 1,2-alpha-mannosidase IC [Saguinus oedipus]|uniref:Mannosyl-oligosaccharide 1,2-alpha-mannosidase IC n=1 Tax=Saguinus oedipus TaxID=9490 RepID=A0ABQ9VA12_SAGOE|nr:Mannosyl-oligosaccharide 1,2-alpha-mannosidase IC [Saguinus oedipus]